MMKRKITGIRLLTGLLLVIYNMSSVYAGPRGSEFDCTLMPAAGGMEGVGTARPQDPVCMLFANPATLTQLKGNTTFTLGATYASPQLEASGTPTDLFGGPAAGAPLTGSFSGSSRITALVAPHAAVIQRLSDKLVVGFGFTGVSGLGSDFRDVAGLPNIIADLKLFGGNMVAAYKISDQLSIGGAFTVGIGNLQAGLTGSGAAVNNLGVGGSIGATFNGGPFVIGIAYKAPLEIEYENAVEVAPNVFSDLTLEQPQEVQIGIATSEALFKDTVIELDARYKNWDDADGYSSFWKDQYVVSIGGQHKIITRMGAVYLRTGYSWGSTLAKDREDLGTTFGEIRFVKSPTGVGSLPVTPTFLELSQATIADGHWRQSVSIGIGYEIPKSPMRLDVNASYAFDGEKSFGRFKADGSLFTAGMGITWEF